MVKLENWSFIDLFAGCGGLSLGLEEAGFKPVLYSELNKAAAETYYKNRKEEIDEGKIKYIADVKNVSGIEYKAIDLVCGGPPCQGFSGIGHRRSYKDDRENMPKNKLYLEMIRVIKEAEPKLFLFENVRGILTARWNSYSTIKGEIFNQILDSFNSIIGEKYDFRWDIIKCSDYGIPQNRPRVFIIGIHKDLQFSGERDMLEVKKYGHAIEDKFFPYPSKNRPPGIEELLSDLVDDDYRKDYLTNKYLYNPKTLTQKELRRHKREEGYLKKGELLSEQEYSRHRDSTIKKFEYMQRNNGSLGNYKTKKFAQRLLPPKWGEKGPTITATSLPDDYVHYIQPRTLTVREWARLQTFPDYYKFCGTRTTGGLRRAGLPDSTSDNIDLPKYTQIGNAVPVFLARQIGEHLIKILKG